MYRRCVDGLRGVVEGVGFERRSGMGPSEQVGRQDERAEDVVRRGGEDRGAVWGPLSALEVIALILGVGPLGAFAL